MTDRRSEQGKSGSPHGRSCSSARRSTRGSATSWRVNDGSCRGCRGEGVPLRHRGGQADAGELFEAARNSSSTTSCSGRATGGCPAAPRTPTVQRRVPHLEAADVTLICSRAPHREVPAYRRRMGWSFPWVSCYERTSTSTSVSPQTEDGQSRGGAAVEANEVAALPSGATRPERSCRRSPRTTPTRPVRTSPAISPRARGQRLRARGRNVYHSYSSDARGSEFVMTYYAILDRTPRAASPQTRAARGFADTTSTSHEAARLPDPARRLRKPGVNVVAAQDKRSIDLLERQASTVRIGTIAR